VDPYAWSWNAEALVVLGLTVAYLAAVRLDAPGPWRVASFLGATALLLVVSVTPIHTLGMHYLLTMHLLQNVVLAEWAPLLVVLGLPSALAATLARPKAFRALTHPAVALPLWLWNYMIWHLPWIYDTALEHPHSLLHLEHALYFLTGVAMWWSVLQDEPHRLSAGARAGVVLAAFVLGSPIGLVIALVPNAIYDFYVEAHHRLWGLDPLEDQQLAGMGMAVEQAVVFFVVFAYWVFRFFAEQDQASAEGDALEAQYPPGTRP
jgi:cytochrome c oxidase assembly factor CtaG